MRSTLIASMILSLAAGAAVAGPRMSGASEAAPSSVEKYRGYVFDLSENADRKDVTSIADMVRRQLDVVETAGFSPKVLQFFHRVPIVASEMACLDEGAAAACYGLTPPEWDRGTTRDVTIWDHDKQQWTNSDPLALALDSGIGIIRMRPNMMRYAKDPVLLHEFLHAYHARLMPNGFENKGIKGFLSQAKSKELFAKEAYALKNQQEFFAVTASIFLAGKDSEHEPYTRATLKEKMPDYYKFLVGLFGADPDETGVTPVASAN
ncbi:MULTISPECIES: hypothetical protein [Bradyrhizobium]|uniref:Zinc-dependent peptidase n=1 Tax=Bradyrhizobium brasilense TaxID=1419277 RepID=A0ABY8J8X3_9BRAD|nr:MULTISPECIES: hypothetical protein [Bradyrhizobium]MCP1833212.1 hypothetical protein [Bradyrhizobium sp. USDA 4545]MCP1917956.1 hypothetical protein [Bradyrhizobium sp. USDA 4532]WFU60453.1 hypothetical protein QA636_23140 [Bradyrhizobium brasilense]